MTQSDITRRPMAASATAALGEHGPRYVDWGAIFAGGAIATAIFTLLATFGAALGLSAMSPYRGEGFSATALGIATALWALWITGCSYAAGGYFAARLRRPVGDATEHERDMRDGAHGFVVWALASLLLAWIAASSIGGLARGAANAAGSAANVAATSQTDPMAYLSDRLWRTSSNAPANATPMTDDQRQAVGRVLARSVASGAIAPEDRTYLASQVAQRTGVPQQEAEKRIDDAVAAMKSAADRARKIAVLTAFGAAATLLIGAAAAWWAASLGGRHRDEGVDLSAITAWR